MTTEHSGYLIKPLQNSPSVFYIVTAGRGGKIPDALNGMYTSTGLAKKAIDKYLATKPPKEAVNDKEISKSGD